MALLISHKQGATFSYADLLAIPAGNWTGKSQVRRANTAHALLADGVVTIGALNVNNLRPILVTIYAQSTQSWPLEDVEWDVRFTDDSIPPQVLMTETVNITVQRAVTAP